MAIGICCYNKRCVQCINNHCIAGYSHKVVCSKRKASFNAREYIKNKENFLMCNSQKGCKK